VARLHIREDDLRGPEIAALLQEHLQDVAQHSPAESIHALDLEALCAPEMTFWTAWEEGELVGCGALKDLGGGHGEIKSMRTGSAHLRKVVASRILENIIKEVESRSLTRLSLETGSMVAFEAARSLYRRFGFDYCGPFAEYKEDPNSVFMTRSF
jgi:putative acetyltransferase